MPSEDDFGSSGLAAGATFGSFVIERELGQGGMGVVYLASREDDSSHPVALKILRGELCADDRFRHRFMHEVSAARSVSHPHLVPIVDSGEAAGIPFLASRYVSGGTLAERIATEPAVSPWETVRWIAHIAGALDALHDAGLIHRDVKSTNIMLEAGGGSAFLTDFGLAKGPAHTVLTRTGQIVGTLDYMSPEIIRGEPAVPASDIYGLACVAFECLACLPPFSDRGTFKIAMAHLDEQPRDPSEGRAGTPPGLGAAILLGLEKEPSARPSTATAYANMLALSLKERPQ